MLTLGNITLPEYLKSELDINAITRRLTKGMAIVMLTALGNTWYDNIEVRIPSGVVFVVPFIRNEKGKLVKVIVVDIDARICLDECIISINLKKRIRKTNVLQV